MIETTDSARSGSYGISFEGHGYLDFGWRDACVTFYPEQDLPIDYKHSSLLTGSMFIDFWKSGDSRYGILLNHTGKDVYHFDAVAKKLTIAIQLNREECDDFGLYYTKFEPVYEDILLIYEKGVVLLDKEGSVCWFKDHHKLDYHFRGVYHRYIWFESEYKGKWKYAVSNGAESLQTDE
ncbi:hypothetical protein [Gloeobacter violaceus]|uniref:hypothetical protein n=1 Tax=Gloeobacter violaceus TaxID=33072 RepID=UPI0013E8DD9A|nr:hypothetical protein [Gloeobacter violaceus]